MPRRAAILLAIYLLPMAGVAAAAGFPEEALEIKRLFAGREAAAVAQPFTGVHTAGGIEPGLYPIRSTGVSTEPIRAAAERFLDTLAVVQTMRTQFPFDDEEWRRWSNVDNGIYSRRGTSLKEMSPEQRAAAMDLLRVSLSARGLAQTEAVMLTDQALSEINNDPYRYDRELYYLTIMGSPSRDKPWGWQFEGHHLVLNFFVLGDQVVMTPAFWGAEPVRWKPGTPQGYELLQHEQDLGLALMQGFDARQRAAATIASRKGPEDIKAGSGQDNRQLDYAGIEASALSAGQRAQLVELIASYVGTMRDGHARVKMDEVIAHLDNTWFAWIGGASDDAVFYYRIHSPVILIEFDHQNPVGTQRLNTPGVPTREHIHTIVRTPNGNDYGKDLLGQHLRSAHAAVPEQRQRLAVQVSMPSSR